MSREDYPIITPAEAQEMMEEFDTIVIDVREPHEVAVGSIEGSIRIPLGELPDRFQELPRDQKLVVHCKLGGRSAKAVVRAPANVISSCATPTP